jgi:phosphoglycolate phosphatase
LILFDIDGTLIVTGGAGQRALDRTFEQLFGIAGAFASVELPGRTDPLIVGDALRAHGIAERDHDGTRFRERYVEALASEMMRDHPAKRLLPGIRPLLDALSGRDDRILALLTGNFEPSARIKLEHFDLWRYFGWGAFGDDAPDRDGLVPVAVERGVARGHPRVPPERIVVIGDTPRDVSCAAAAGARSIAVATGGASAEQLRVAGADVVFESLADTARVLWAIDDLIAGGAVQRGGSAWESNPAFPRSAGSDRF